MFGHSPDKFNVITCYYHFSIPQTQLIVNKTIYLHKYYVWNEDIQFIICWIFHENDESFQNQVVLAGDQTTTTTNSIRLWLKQVQSKIKNSANNVD